MKKKMYEKRLLAPRKYLLFTLALLLIVCIPNTLALCKSELPSTSHVQPNIALDRDWDYQSNPPHMVSIPTGNVGIGDMPPTNAKLYVKSDMMAWQYGLYTESGLGIKSVSTAWEGTGIVGEGGHAGVAGNGYIGLLGQGFWGGWFEGHGYFSGKVGIAQNYPEHALHVNGAIHLDPIEEPTNPSSGFILYCDQADGLLKAKASTGTITLLAEP